MSTQTNNAVTIPATIQERKAIDLFTDKNGKPLTAKQAERKIMSAKRKETNEARKNLARSIKDQLYNLKTLRTIMQDEALTEDVNLWLHALKVETGKDYTLAYILKINVSEYMDYVRELEAIRGHVRGINPNEFMNIITRYLRGEKVSNFDEAHKVALADAWERKVSI
jgi:hypothetical protein